MERNGMRPTRTKSPWWSSKKSLVKWRKRYDQEQGDGKTEQILGLRLAKSDLLSKKDLLTMVRWKFDFFKGRMEKEVKMVEKMPENTIREAFKRAVILRDDQSRIIALDKLAGIGPAMISAILTFYDPMNYGVIDIHAWRELFGSEPKGFPSQQHLLRFLDQLRKIARVNRLAARDVEKALFQRNYEKS